MPNQPSLTPPDSIAAMRTLFFGRLAEINCNLTGAFEHLSAQIDNQNHNGCLGLIVLVDDRIQAMRNILLVLREYLGGSTQKPQQEEV